MPSKPDLPDTEETVLVLQGGGALGAYQAGAYLALCEGGLEVDWVAGISIGAINGAIIAGNPGSDRSGKLHAFWEEVTADAFPLPWLEASVLRPFANELAAAQAMFDGVSGFFTPRFNVMGLPSVFSPEFWKGPVSFYDTSPLRNTLLDLVDFDYLNEKGPRLSVGAVEVETGNFTYFDSAAHTLLPEHIMASGALPPGFPPVEIDGKHYWDGGLVSNTPLQFVLEEPGDCPLLIFQIDLFSARGHLPETMLDVQQREKDIRYSSRTRLTTDRYRQLHDIAGRAARLRDKLPPDLRDDPDMMALCEAGPSRPVTLALLIHRPSEFASASKDYEFSRLSMTERWQAGHDDAARTLANPLWAARKDVTGGIDIFDLGTPDDADGPRKRKVSAL